MVEVEDVTAAYQLYLDKLRDMVTAVRLTAFWTQKAAEAAERASDYTDEVASCIYRYLDRQLDTETETILL